MIPESDDFVVIRQRRARRVRAAELLAELKPVKILEIKSVDIKTAEIESADLEATNLETTEPVNWAMLLEVPEWCYWPPARREQLVLIAGALFAAPAMRLWIEAKRIETARTIVGADVFDRVMVHESVFREAPQLPADENVRELLLTAGAGVLLGSLAHACLRDRLASLLPRPAGTLPYAIAAMLAADALALMAMLAPSVEQLKESTSPPKEPPMEPPMEPPKEPS